MKRGAGESPDWPDSELQSFDCPDDHRVFTRNIAFLGYG